MPRSSAAGLFIVIRWVAKINEHAKLERLCRYIIRPAVSTKRLSLTRNSQVRYELKTPWRNGTTHVIFEPLDFISRLVSLDCRDAGGRATQGLSFAGAGSLTRKASRSRDSAIPQPSRLCHNLELLVPCSSIYYPFLFIRCTRFGFVEALAQR